MHIQTFNFSKSDFKPLKDALGKLGSRRVFICSCIEKKAGDLAIIARVEGFIESLFRKTFEGVYRLFTKKNFYQGYQDRHLTSVKDYACREGYLKTVSQLFLQRLEKTNTVARKNYNHIFKNTGK